MWGYYVLKVCSFVIRDRKEVDPEVRIHDYHGGRMAMEDRHGVETPKFIS